MLTKTIPSYLYQQYADDDDLQAFVASYNTLTQEYVDTFNNLGLPIYTGLSGDLLDWVGAGIYGYPRPVIPGAGAASIGPLNTYGPDYFVPLNSQETTPAVVFTTTDDLYKRLLTWHFYKGDGKVFNIEWLKRRIMRFLLGENGTAPAITNTFNVSVVFSAPYTVDVQIPTYNYADYLAAAIQSGAAETPFQYSFNITVTNPVGSIVDWNNNSSATVDWTNNSSAVVTWNNYT